MHCATHSIFMSLEQLLKVILITSLYCINSLAFLVDMQCSL